MLSRAREEKGSNRYSGEVIATKDGEWKRKAVSDVDGVSSHYTREGGNIMTSTLSQKAHLVLVCEDALNVWSEWSSYANRLSHVDYKGHGKVSKKHPFLDK